MSILGSLFSTRAESVSSGVETRSIEHGLRTLNLNDPASQAIIFGSAAANFSGESVGVQAVLGIPAAWAAVDVIATAIASLPVHVYRRSSGGRERVRDGDPLQSLLNSQVNEDYLTSAEFRRGLVVQYLTRGRGLAWIERDKAGRVTNLWPLDKSLIEVKLTGHRRTYVEASTGRVWAANEVIDLVWMPDGSPGGHIDPIIAHANTFGLAIAADRYSARAFRNGGVAPLKLKPATGMSPEAIARATAGINQALQAGGNVLPLMADMDLTPVGFDPAAMQLLELKRQLVIEISRIFRIPPTMIQSLENGTYSNTEQLALQFVTQTIQPIVEQIEEEFQAKLFGRANRTLFVKFNLDALARGDLKTRFEAFRTAIHGAFRTPNEIRALDDLPPIDGGDQLLIQGATIPLTMAGSLSSGPTPGAEPPTDLAA